MSDAGAAMSTLPQHRCSLCGEAWVGTHTCPKFRFTPDLNATLPQGTKLYFISDVRMMERLHRAEELLRRWMRRAEPWTLRNDTQTFLGGPNWDKPSVPDPRSEGEVTR